MTRKVIPAAAVQARNTIEARKPNGPGRSARTASSSAGQASARPAVPPAVGELTPREREVLDLLVRGLSNPEICRELVVSEATAKTHVAKILQKLGVRDRVQAVIYAYETGLVAPSP